MESQVWVFAYDSEEDGDMSYCRVKLNSRLMEVLTKDIDGELVAVYARTLPEAMADFERKIAAFRSVMARC